MGGGGGEGEHWKKRPTKKVNNRLRPLETNVRSGRATKRILAKTWLPYNGFSI